jgi:hypothetical protein
MTCHYNLFQHLLATLNSVYWARNTDIVVKPVPTHKPHVYVAPVVRPEDNSGPNAAVLWPYGAGGTQQNRSARQYMWLL